MKWSVTQKTIEVSTMRKLILGIGAPRSGTTWTYENLRICSNIFVPPVKELRFFTSRRSNELKIKQANNIIESEGYSNQDKEFVKQWLKVSDGDTSKYLSLFQNHSIFCDISPIYCTLNQKQVGIIYQTVRHIECDIFLLLRNPFFRDLSHIIFSLHRQKNITSEHASDYYLKYLNNDRFKARSNYPQIIENWNTYFGSNLKLFFYDKLQENPKSFFENFCQELNLTFDITKIKTSKVNKSGSESRYKITLPRLVYDLLYDRSLFCIDNLKDLNFEIRDKWIKEINNFMAEKSVNDTN